MDAVFEKEAADAKPNSIGQAMTNQLMDSQIDENDEKRLCVHGVQGAGSSSTTRNFPNASSNQPIDTNMPLSIIMEQQKQMQTMMMTMHQLIATRSEPQVPTPLVTQPPEKKELDKDVIDMLARCKAKHARSVRVHARQ